MKWTSSIGGWLVCSWLAACGGGDATPAETFVVMFGDSFCGAIAKCVSGTTAAGVMRCKVAEKDVIGEDVQAVSKGTETFNQASADQCIKQIEALDCATVSAVAMQDPQAEATIDAKAPACNEVFAKK